VLLSYIHKTNTNRKTSGWLGAVSLSQASSPELPNPISDGGEGVHHITASQLRWSLRF